MKYNNSSQYQQDTYYLISTKQTLLPHNELIPRTSKNEADNQYKPIMVNQINISSIQNISLSEINTWGTMPHNINCPFCHKYITTLVETNCNIGSCCLCFWLSCLVWAAILLFKGKEIGCADATHKCPNCKNVIGIYHSC